jgi:hypothetical protein
MQRVHRLTLPVASVLVVGLIAFAVDVQTAGAATPSIAAPASASPGGSLTVSGTACVSTDPASSAWVQVDVVDQPTHTQDVAQGNATPDASGAWSTQLQVSATASDGAYDLLATCLQGPLASPSFIFDYTVPTVTIGTATTTSTVPSTSTSTTATITSSSSSSGPPTTSDPIAPCDRHPRRHPDQRPTPATTTATQTAQRTIHHPR